MALKSEKDDYFIFDSEMHLLRSLEHVAYEPHYQLRKRRPLPWARAMFGAEGNPGRQHLGKERIGQFWETAGREGCVTIEELVALMDKYGVDMACLIPHPNMINNGEFAGICERYPDRLVFVPSIGPLIEKGAKRGVWELEYLVKERNAKGVKFRPHAPHYINSPEMWPFYEKICELDIPISIHMLVIANPSSHSKYCLPMLLEDVMCDFPDMKVIGFHMGWPYHHDLNALAGAYPNVYVGLSYILNWAVSAPLRFAELIGQAIRVAGPDRVVWGTDAFAPAELCIANAVLGFKDFQIPEEMQRGYGYEPLTVEVKRKIFGENLAKLLKIEPRKRVKA